MSPDRSVGNVQTSYHGVSVMMRRCAHNVLVSVLHLSICKASCVGALLHNTALLASSMYDPLEDNSEIGKDEAEGQNSTLVDNVLSDTQKDCAGSQKVCN